MKKYAYKCLECKAISAHKGDGYCCPACGGYITAIGHFVEKPGRIDTVTVGVEIDGLIDMKALMERINGLIDMKALMERINELARQMFNLGESQQGGEQ